MPPEALTCFSLHISLAFNFYVFVCAECMLAAPVFVSATVFVYSEYPFDVLQSVIFLFLFLFLLQPLFSSNICYLFQSASVADFVYSEYLLIVAKC